MSFAEADRVILSDLAQRLAEVAAKPFKELS